MMKILRAAPPAAKPAEVVVPPAAAAPSSGGFTQLLRALNYEQVKPAEQVKPTEQAKPAEPVLPVASAPVPVPPPPPPAGVGSITQLLRTFDEPEAAEPPPMASASPIAETPAQAAIRAMEEGKPAASPAPPPVAASNLSSTFQVTSFRQAPSQPVISVEPPVQETPRVETPPAAPGSFTQLFSSLDASKNEAAKVQETPAASGPGSFTQMLNAPLGAEGRSASVEPQPAAPPVAPSAPGSFTQMFQALDTPVEPAKVEATAAPSTPGSFTQMFSTPASAPVEPSVAVPQTRPAAPSTPGSFTQMFQALDTPQPEAVKVENKPAGGSPGAFTQMFSRLNSPSEEASKAEAKPASSGAGSFTQLFGTLNAEPGPLSPPAKVESFSPAQPVYREAAFEQPQPDEGRAPDAGTSGVSQVFSTYRAAPEAARADAFSPSAAPPYNPPVRPTEPSAPAKGGLTQLLRTLDQPGPSGGQPLSSGQGFPAPSQQPGAFTAVYGKLDGGNAAPPPVAPVPPPQNYPPSFPPAADNRDATQAFRMPQASAPLAAPPVGAGPSEFTRILNASTLRESLLRGEGAPAAEPAVAAPAQSPSGMGFPPVAMPSMPSIASPHVGLPNMSIPHGGGGAAPQAPHLSMPATPQAPQLPKVPTVQVAAPGGGKMQQYLPLLLIMIIFLLVAVLVAVIFLMKH
jgi:hypothetical protein